MTIRSFNNLQCIVDAFDSERGDHFIQLRSQLNIPSKQVEKETNKDPLFKGIGFLQRVNHLMRDVAGFDDPEVPPTSFAELIRMYYTNNEELLDPQKLDWVNRQCAGFVEGVIDNLKKSLFICSKLVVMRSDEIKHLMELEETGFRYIGRLIYDVVQDVDTSLTPIENKNEKFAVRFFELEKNQKEVEKYFNTFSTKFLDLFDEEYDRLVRKFTENSEFTSEIEKALKIVLPENDPLLTVRIESISMMLLDNRLSLERTSAVIIKEVILKYSQAFNESPYSRTYTQLSKIIVELIQSKLTSLIFSDTESENEPHIYFKNIILPFCLQKMIENAEMTDTRFIITCNELHQVIFPESSTTQTFINYLMLESQEGKETLLKIIHKNILKSRYLSRNDYSQLSENVRKQWLLEIINNMNILQSVQPKGGSIISMDRTQLLLYRQMKDLVSINPTKGVNLISPVLIKDTKSLLKDNVWDSDKIFRFVEQKKTEISDELGDQATALKLTLFFSHLMDNCSLNKHQQQLSLCVAAVNDAKKHQIINDFLPYTYNNVIFDLIINRLFNEVDKYDVIPDGETYFAIRLSNGILYHFVEFQEELNELKKKDPHFVDVHGERKSMMYVLIAKMAYGDHEVRLPAKVFDMIVKWSIPKADKLVKLMIETRDFNEELKDLQAYIYEQLFSDMQDRKRMMGMKNSAIKNTVTENGISMIDKKEIADNMKGLLLFYNLFTEKLKRKLVQCSPSMTIYNGFNQFCTAKFGRSCIRLNPFIMGKPCPDGYDHNENLYCESRCPEHFAPADNNLCLKPKIELIKSTVDSKTKVEYLKCPSGLYQNDLLCIGRCPIGWKDLGDACLKPRADFNMEGLILIVN